MKDNLEKCELILSLKRKEIKQLEMKEFYFYISKLLKKDKSLKDTILTKIDEKMNKDKNNVEEPPQHLTCPISFVSLLSKPRIYSITLLSLQTDILTRKSSFFSTSKQMGRLIQWLEIQLEQTQYSPIIIFELLARSGRKGEKTLII